MNVIIFIEEINYTYILLNTFFMCICDSIFKATTNTFVLNYSCTEHFFHVCNMVFKMVLYHDKVESGLLRLCVIRTRT